MNVLKLALRNLRYYLPHNLTTAAGIMAAAAVIGGALIIGDSVRASLFKLVSDRLGKVEYAVIQQENYFRSAIAGEIAAKTGTDCAAVLQVEAFLASEHGAVKANLYGVSRDFFRLSPAGNEYSLPPDTVWLNRTAMQAAGLKTGETALLRILKPDRMPADIPMTSLDQVTAAMRVQCGEVVPNLHFGDFSMVNSQTLPVNLFVDRKWLAAKLGIPGKANWLLAAKGANPAALTAALKKSITADDLGWKLSTLQDKEISLKCDRVFIPPQIVGAISKLKIDHRLIMTGFVNKIESGKFSTPYSFVCGMQDKNYPEGDENCPNIWVSGWLAGDLSLRVGGKLKMTYYVITPLRTLVEKSTEFKVAGIYTLKDDQPNRELMPDYPGMTDSESCRDWNTGLPIDTGRIRPRDEAYWESYRGTPKAFISYKTAARIWGNRFGEATACRFTGKTTPQTISEKLLAQLSAQDLNLQWTPVLQDGLQGSRNAVDFGQLFMGLSFFVVAAALLLTGVLAGFNLERRANDIMTLTALGWERRRIIKLLFIEHGAVAVAGAVCGIPLAVLYAKGLLWGIASVWSGTVGRTRLVFEVNSATLLLTFAVSCALSLLVLLIVQSKFLKKRPVETAMRQIPAFQSNRPWHKDIWLRTACVMLLAAVVIMLLNPGHGEARAGIFFGCGSLLLTGALLLCMVFVRRLPALFKNRRPGLILCGLRNCSRRPGRSLAAIALLSSGIFLITAVSVNRQGVLQDPARRDSGTGGFALYIETALPVLADLNTAEGRLHYHLDLPENVRFVQLSAAPGSESSCLNLNRVSRPRILGVIPEELDSRFSFAGIIGKPASPWDFLNRETGSAEIIPAIADMAVINWSLGKKIGDIIDYEGENGRHWKLLLVGGLENSLFQGSVLISRQNFMRMFPDISGSKIMLADARPGDLKPLISSLAKGLTVTGPQIEISELRLARYNVVQNTYLTIFLALGGLGLIIGSAGLGILLLRNMLERLPEFAWMRAAGFSRRDLITMLLAEHLFIFFCGLCCGIAGAAAAILPALSSPAGSPPWSGLAIFYTCLLLTAGAVTVLAARYASRLNIIASLRNE